MFFATALPVARDVALRYADSKGRLATLPDVIDARLATSVHDPIWAKEVITNSGEYYGLSRNRSPLVIIGHAVGPLTLRHTYQRRVVFGRGWFPDLLPITQMEFRKLESGLYGDVQIYDARLFCRRESYTARAAKENAIIRARLGPRADEYLDKHSELSHRTCGNTCVIDNDERYEIFPRALAALGRLENFAAGSLLSIGPLMRCTHYHALAGRYHEGLLTDIRAGAVSGAARFLGIRG